MSDAGAAMTSPPTDDDKQNDGGGAGGKRGSGSEDEILAGWYRMAGVGIEFIVAIALFVGIGYAIDRWRGSSPWGVLVGAAIGFTIGLRAMIRAAKKSFKQ